MARSTKPVRMNRDDAERIRDLADEYDARPADIVDELLTVADLDSLETASEPVGACPLCGYQFSEDEVRSPVLSSVERVTCPDPDNRHEDTGIDDKFRLEELDEV